jgi:hypothetical protein
MRFQIGGNPSADITGPVICWSAALNIKPMNHPPS